MYIELLLVDITGQNVLQEKYSKDGDNGYKQWLKPVAEFVRINSEKHDISDVRMTKYLVKFKIKGFVYVNVLVSPFWNDKTELYGFLKSIDEDDHNRYASLQVQYILFSLLSARFIASATKWQVKFLRRIPPQVACA